MTEIGVQEKWCEGGLNWQTELMRIDGHTDKTMQTKEVRENGEAKGMERKDGVG
jgi:hypothetical protein